MRLSEESKAPITADACGYLRRARRPSLEMHAVVRGEQGAHRRRRRQRPPQPSGGALHDVRPSRQPTERTRLFGERHATHVSSSCISAFKTGGAGGDSGLSRMVTSGAPETKSVTPGVCLIAGASARPQRCPQERLPRSTCVRASGFPDRPARLTARHRPCGRRTELCSQSPRSTLVPWSLCGARYARWRHERGLVDAGGSWHWSRTLRLPGPHACRPAGRLRLLRHSQPIRQLARATSSYQAVSATLSPSHPSPKL